MSQDIWNTAPEDKVLSVTALTQLINDELEQRFPFVWVRGEIADFAVAQSGHMYFSLKDSRSVLQCVWFAGKRKAASAGQKFDPLTGEVFDNPRPDPARIMRNGLEIICAGAVSVFGPAGRHQLVIELVEPIGAGAQALILEERKERLARAGYFASARKRPIPLNPAKVALITSPSGAAIHDFLKMAQTRGLGSTIRLFPVPVQGAGAARRISEAIELANDQRWADLIVLIRGGGSAEDLGEFNEEELATAIFQSGLPVVAGIGHEVDTFIADMTADARAATPTHAAQLIWPLRQEMAQRLDSMQLSLDQAWGAQLERKRQKLEDNRRALRLLSPARRHAAAAQRLEQLLERLARAVSLSMRQAQTRVDQCARALRKPLAVSHVIMRSRDRLDILERQLGKLGDRLIPDRFQRADALSARLSAAGRAWLADKISKYGKLDDALAQRDPLLPLERGYAVLFSESGIINSIEQCAVPQIVGARLRDGELAMQILKVSPLAPDADVPNSGGQQA